MSAHVCHAPGCKTIVLPSMFMCRPHWYALPHEIRAGILAEHRDGQEADNKPSVAFVAAVARAREWIAEHA